MYNCRLTYLRRARVRSSDRRQSWSPGEVAGRIYATCRRR